MGMFDISKVHNISGGDIAFRRQKYVAWEALEFQRENSLAQQSVVSWSKPGMTRIEYKIQLSDLPGFGAERPPMHRYFWPQQSGGLNIMLEMPKAIVFFPEGYSPGEPMIVRYYFWASSLAVDKLPTPYTIESLLAVSSDIIDEVVPIPDYEWKPPMWKQLPPDFNHRAGISRYRSLVARF
jgi:hypothetical protein